MPNKPEHFPLTRLAPSPTGALHLGNIRTFLANWAMARRQGWGVILRIEDLDGPRVKPGAVEATIETLRWLGMDWDGDVWIQSHDLGAYRAAMRMLANMGKVYPSAHTRGELESVASAPQEGVHESVFPATMRPAIGPREFDDEGVNWRLVVGEVEVEVEDEFLGRCVFEPSKSIGDFVVWTKRGVPAYQLAVVVDDHRQGVGWVVRGDDLLESSARQGLVYQALGVGPIPGYVHLPLVRGSDGRRLAKRHGDTRVEGYRSRGVSAERIIALIARWCGMGACEKMDAGEFRAAFDLARVPREGVVFTPEDDAWLLSAG